MAPGWRIGRRQSDCGPPWTLPLVTAEVRQVPAGRWGWASVRPGSWRQHSVPKSVLSLFLGLLGVALDLVDLALGFEGFITSGLADDLVGSALQFLGFVPDLGCHTHRALLGAWIQWSTRNGLPALRHGGRCLLRQPQDRWLRSVTLSHRQ